MSEQHYVKIAGLTDQEIRDNREYYLEQLLESSAQGAYAHAQCATSVIRALDAEDIRRGRNFEGRPLMNDEGFCF